MNCNKCSDCVHCTDQWPITGEWKLHSAKGECFCNQSSEDYRDGRYTRPERQVPDDCGGFEPKEGVAHTHKWELSDTLRARHCCECGAVINDVELYQVLGHKHCSSEFLVLVCNWLWERKLSGAK